MNLNASLTDKSNALEALQYCQDVYTRSDIETEAAHVTVTQLADCILVAHRGSKSAEDWIHDAEFEMMDTPYGRMHRGFWDSEREIQPLLLAKLRTFPTKPIVHIGHSLGGAQCTISAITTQLVGCFKVAKVINFGSPRVGDRDFQQFYDGLFKEVTIRYVDARDIVARMPWELGYVHVGNEGFLPSSSNTLELNPTEWQLIEDDIKGAIEDLSTFRPELLNDHHLERYRSRIEALP